MRIVENKTSLDNKKLQQLFCFVHQLIAKTEGRLRQWKRMRVFMSYRNTAGYSGKATLGGTKIWIRFCLVSYNNIETLSQVFAHELMHSYGFGHKGFRRFPLDEKQIAKIKTRFVDMKSFWKPYKEKPKVDVIVVRYQRMVSNKKYWEKKFKFSSTKYKKYSRMIRGYQKKYSERLKSV